MAAIGSDAQGESIGLRVAGAARPLVRVRLSRWEFLAVAGVVILAAVSVGAAVGACYGAYTTLRQQRWGTTALVSRLAEQQATIDLYRKRVGEVRAEIEGWRELQAKVLRPFGPEGGATTRAAGIGGGRALSSLDATPDGGDVGEELARLGAAVREVGENLRSLEGFLSGASRILASLPSRWPLRGPLNSDFGRRLSLWSPGSEFHSGLDIGAPAGTPVRAPAPGTVVFAGRHPEYGLSAVIDHGNDTQSLYGHLSRLNVDIAQKVTRGQVIALSGNTGRSSGPHLHYEIRVKGHSVNPHNYLWE